MVVNNLRDREHGWRLVVRRFIDAAIVSVIGLAQVPSGERVSAPFEGESASRTPSWLSLFMMAIAAGIAFETETRAGVSSALVLLGVMGCRFFFSSPRSYLGLIPPSSDRVSTPRVGSPWG